MLTKRGKRILELGDDEDERIRPKKYRWHDENEEDVNIFSNQELGERWGGKNMDTYNFSGYARDNLDMDYLSDSTEEDNRPSENVTRFYQPSQNSISSRNSAKFVNSGMNTMETGNIRQGQSCPMDCHPSGSSNIPTSSHSLHNCQHCTTREKSQKRRVNMSRQSSKRSLKSTTSRKSKSRTRPSMTDRTKNSMHRRTSNETQSKKSSRLHFCQFCAGGGKSSIRSMKLSRQASRRSLKSKTSRRSLKSKTSRRSLKSKASRKSVRPKMSRKSLPKNRPSTTGRTSRNITRSHSRTSTTSRCGKRKSPTSRCTSSKGKVRNKKGDYSLPREIFNRLVSYYQNSVKQKKNNKK